MSAPGGKPAAVKVGPGILYIADLGTTEPDGPSSTAGLFPSAWRPLGYTDSGHTFNQQISSTPIEVAEELEPISNSVTSRVSTVTFALAQLTARNLQLALNGGSTDPVASSGVVKPTVPEVGQEKRIMLGWDSGDGLERWIYRQCFNTGALNIPRGKGAKAVIPVTFTLERPANGLFPYQPLLDASLAS